MGSRPNIRPRRESRPSGRGQRGASIVELTWGGRKIVFSGDLGRYGDPTMPDPAAMNDADYLLVESTYGDRLHDRRAVEPILANLIEGALRRGGSVVIPSFAVGRAQSLLYHLERLKSAGRLADVPIYLDSPMAIDASAARFRPIILTAISTVLGMIPIAWTVFWGPMAFAIMGGLLVATILTLIFLPTLYVAWFGWREGGKGSVPEATPAPAAE